MSFNQQLNCLSLEKKKKKKNSVLSCQEKSFVCQTETQEPAALLTRQDFKLAEMVLLLLRWPTFDTRSLSVLVAYEKLHQQPSKMAAKLLNLCNAERLLLPHLLVLIHATMSGWMHFPWGSSSGSVPHGERLSGRDNAVCIVPPDLLPHKAGLLIVCNS